MPERRVPQVKEVMTPFPHFIEVEQGVARARELMVAHGVRHLPVKEAGELVGVVTARDLEVAAAAASGRDLALRDLCDKDLFVVDLHARMDRVMKEMAVRRVSAALVVKEGRLAGILTTADVCRLYGELLGRLAPPDDEPA